MIRHTAPLSVYFDQSCPMCNAEMQLLHSLSPEHSLVLIDCSVDDFNDEHANSLNISQAQLMHRIHARDTAGVWFKGVDVFVLCYGLAGQQGIAKALAQKQLRPFWNALYPAIVASRNVMSALGLHKLYMRVMRHITKRELAKQVQCVDGHCGLKEYK